MQEFNDSSSMWTKAKQEHDASIDRIMKRDYVGDPADHGNRLQNRLSHNPQVRLQHLRCGPVKVF